MSWKRIFGGVATATGAVCALGGTAQAQEADQVMVVPYSQREVTLPHPTHEGAPMTLKAIVRNAQCNTYRVWWDVNRNGNYDDDWSRDVARNGTTLAVYDIGRTFIVPAVARSEKMNINVRVRNLCTNADKFGTMRLFVNDWVPSADPVNWTAEQLEVMTSMSVQESLWYHHRQMTNISGANNTPTILGYSPYEAATNLVFWQYTINGHQPAYPPGTINWHGLPQPAGFVQENDRRWNADPYAETVTRHINYITASSQVVGMAAGEEQNTCGYTFDGANYQVRTCNRVPNTTNDQGIVAVGGANTYRMGMNLGALATAMPALAGTPIQSGPVNYEWTRYIQEMTDYLGYMQVDAGCSEGGWYYDTRHGGAGECHLGDFSTTQWAFVGLEAVSSVGEPFNVFVNNRHKYRVAHQILANQQADGGAAYDNRLNGAGVGSDFKMTGGAILAHRMIGTHRMAADNVDNATLPFPDLFGAAFRVTNNENNSAPFRNTAITQATLIDSYNRHMSYAANWFAQRKVQGSHWLDGNWQNGDYLCGNRNTIYNGGRCGNTYTIYSNQKGYATGLPELTLVGNHDWRRMYYTYYIRAMDRLANAADPMSNYSIFGRVIDDYCEILSVTCSWGSGHMGAAMGGLVLTPTVFNPKPVALGTVQPPVVTAGCAGGNAGLVNFDHSESFHPDANARIIAYQWDVNAANGLWWANNTAPDFVTEDANQLFEYRYLTAGNYTATLRTVDTSGQSHTTTVVIAVNAAANVPPGVAHGGPYAIEVGQNLQLQGTATDQNLGCGDVLRVDWDLDGNGASFGDVNGATANVPWASLANLAQGVPVPLHIRVRDAANATVTAQTTLTIYPRDPIAEGRANPNPAACQQEITFDGSASRHPNPARTLSQFDWNVDGVAGFEGAGQIFRYTYTSFGPRNVTLRVTDDLGRTHSVTFPVNVNQGNVAPVARVAAPEIVVLEDGALVLDGRPSSDANTACGDSITEYAWDLNGNGNFNDPVDVRGANPTVPWNVLSNTLAWPASRETGEPSNRVRLRVTDSFGLTSTAEVVVRIYNANPVAVVVQSPNPSSIRINNGFSSTTLDGRNSFSTVPGVNVVRYDWDLDNNGTFETANAAVVNFNKVFEPVPLPPLAIPVTTVRLQVTDANGRVGVVSYDVVYDIPPTPPTADADPTDNPERGYHLLVGEGVTLDGRQSSDPDEAEGDWVRHLRWDLTYNPADGFRDEFRSEDANGQGGVAARQVALTWAQLNTVGINGPGNHTVRLQVSDTTNLDGVDDAPLSVYAVNPVVVAEANPSPAACGARVTFDGTRSNHPHPGIDIASYSWDFNNDGQADAAGASAQFTFSQFTFGAPNPVRLTVTDTRGNTASGTVNVAVTEGNRAPAPSAGGFRNAGGVVTGPYAIVIGEGLPLSAAGSSDPDAACGDSIQRYQWDLRNDGSFEVEGAQANLTWAQLNAAGINAAGTYDVRVRATDRFGATGDALATLRVVNGPRAVATANPNRAGCNQQVTFSGAGSVFEGPVGQGFDIVAYDWDLDADGQFDDAQGAQFTRPVVALPDAQGQIRVRANLRVTDASGRTATNQVEVIIDVQNQAPVANAGGPYRTGPVQGGFANVVLDARSSSDPNAPCDEIAVYKWDTDNDGLYGADDNPADRVGATVNYNNPGWQINTVQTVRVQACDRANACSQPAEADIEVRAVAPPTGEVLSPRAADNQCMNTALVEVSVRVSDPAGTAVSVVVFASGVEIGRRDNVATPANGGTADVTLSVNPALVPEGRHEFVVRVRNAAGAETLVNSGGRFTFDRTAPLVEIGAQPGANVCYAPNGVPQPAINVTDALDQAPVRVDATTNDGCQRTLRVTATDACGNAGTATRTYLIAEPVSVEIAGAAEGALLSTARMTWAVVGPPACASNTQGSLSRDGGAGVAYAANSLINQPGNYALTVQVANCQGVARTQIRNFTINAPPVAIAIPPGHPQADPGNATAYLVREGDGLQLDGSESRSPEALDSVARYEWDLDNNGTFDVEGVLVAFDTSSNGVFEGRLRVTDSLGATHVTTFRVTVLDVDPIANAGGPYTVEQGTVFQPDGRGSRPGSAADLLTTYTWNWGDGSPVTSGVGLSRPEHVYQADGVYNLVLTVRDEDSEHTVTVVVEVDDVNPIIDAIIPPDDIVEVRPVTFRVDARPGTASDPLTRVEWDFDGDGAPEYFGVGLFEVEHTFDVAGEYTVTVTVRDGDSSTVDGIRVDVRELTLREIIAFIDTRVEATLADPDMPVFVAFELAGIDQFIDRGLWAETQGQRGVTMLSLESVIYQLERAQASGAQFGWELYALSRQLKRELDRQYAAVLNDPQDGRGANHPSMQLAADHIQAATEYFEDANFREDVASDVDAQVALFMYSDLAEGYYWLRDAVDQCNGYNDFALPPIQDPVAIQARANAINGGDLVPALAGLAAELQAYADLAHPAPSVGRERIIDAVAKLDAIRVLQARPLGPICEEDEGCISDRDALELEILGAQLARDLDVAANDGAWVRNWQSCLVLMLKFRIELSIQRVEFACGRNTAVAQRARTTQAIGLEFVADNRDAEALSYYVDPIRQCTLVDVYTQCLVRGFPNDNPRYEGDLDCPEP